MQRQRARILLLFLVLPAPLVLAASMSSAGTVYTFEAPPPLPASYTVLTFSAGASSFVDDDMRRMYGSPAVVGLRLYDVQPNGVQLFVSVEFSSR